MSVPKQVSALVETFARNRETYTSPSYNETQLRREFLDPLFSALGWDVNNTSGYAEAYKDVIHEDSIKIGSATKAPDYCFRIGGTRKFFLEAKKPSTNIKHDIHPAFQLRRYAWSAKLPLSILTDFEEFAVYDGRVRPVKTDKAATARVKYIKYNEYPDRWDEIADIFSRDAILKGSFDKYAVSTRRKGTAEVDAAFLSEIEMWRDSLARNIALRNPGLTNRELNFAVQRTVDRILFLRMCEDRGIEIYGQLLGLTNGGEVYKRLCAVFRRADEKYNSGLFYFEQEKDRSEGPDELTPGLMIDDKVLSPILKRMYYPDSPYEFSVLPAEILGNVYEQFLGKVITLTKGHRAKVEDKPEVKKAGGVYYTPTYIVEYIVKNTVGKLLEGKKPNTAVKLKILDPACGSGSFLIGAYQYLLDWHLRYYTEKGPEQWAKKKNPRVYQNKIDEWKLTTGERKRILLNNIYGVDIDTQAVEVTKLSLLLKVLEGENQASLDNQLKLFHERALPDLSDNIKCGNSLIGPDFYEGRQLELFDDEEMYRINAFDWGAEFPGVFKKTKTKKAMARPSAVTENNLTTDCTDYTDLRKESERNSITEYSGGFDAVIGNPPYGAFFDTTEASYFRNCYHVFKDVKDVYTLFIESSLGRLSPNGFFAFIVPSAWLGGPSYSCLREMFLQYTVEKLILLPFDVFADAYVDTAVFVVSNKKHPQNHQVQTFVYGKREKIISIDLSFEEYKSVYQDIWSKLDGKIFVLNPETIRIIENIRNRTHLTFGDVVKVKRGVLFDKQLLTDTSVSSDSHLYFEGDVYRYQLNMRANHWIEFNDKMRERPKEFIWFNCERLLLRRLVNRKQRLMATYISDTLITNKNLYSIIVDNDNLSIYTALGILNSRLISYLYINQVTQATKDDFPQVTIKDFKSLPFPQILSGDYHHDKIVGLVETILGLHKRLVEAKVPDEKTRIQRQIDSTDQQIDKLVYELYELTEEEIGIVESE